MTEDTYKALYRYGKAVYEKSIMLSDAIEKVCRENPEVAQSSAEHYIKWYGKMREGSFLSWNTNEKLLKYYVEKVIEENPEDADLAIKAERLLIPYRNKDQC